MTSEPCLARDLVRPLSFAQRSLWLIEQFSADARAYTLAWRVDLRGPFNRAAFEHAVSGLAQRHGALRTRIEPGDGHPVQVILPDVVVPVRVEDLRDLSGRETARMIDAACAEERATPFDLSIAPLIRFRVLRLDELKTAVLVVVHHIVFDGSSNGILLDELAALYAAYVEGLPVPAPPARQYTDFVSDQQRLLQGERLERLTRYWREQLAGSPELLELPADRPRPSRRSFAGADLRHRLPADLTGRLQALAGSARATMFMVLLSAYQVLLAQQSGQRDFCVGSNISGRLRTEFSTTIGYFINPLVMRADLTGDPSFREVLRRVRQTCLRAYDHQDLPFEQVVAQVRPRRSDSHSPIFQTAFNMRHVDARPRCFGGLEMTSVAGLRATHTKYDLAIAAVTAGKYIELDVEYATDIFDDATVRRLVARFERLLAAVADNPELRVSEFGPLSPAERRQVLRDWNDTAAPVTSADLGALFAAQSARTPDAVAVTAADHDISYAELNARSDAVACLLRERGVRTEDLVAIALPRSIDLVVAILGVLKAGAAYVPVDPDYPAGRIGLLLSDARAAIVLTTISGCELAAGAGIPAIVLDDPGTWPARDAPPDVAAGPLDPDHAAYVIYTSGSTGTPKGVVVTHRAVANYVQFAVAAYPSLRRGALLHSSVSFDLSVTALFGTLLSGGRLRLIPSLDERGITDLDGDQDAFLKVTPSHLGLLNSLAGQRLPVGDLVAGGEALAGESAREWRTHHPGTRISNEYGPTETTVGCTVLPVEPGDPIPDGVLCIGRPIPNTRIYILDDNVQPVGIGMTGDLYVAGVCLARGYLRRPALTARQFVPCPFEPGQRMYRTGDRARWDSNGRLWFAGRADDQVKIRGYRVEPGEVAATLLDHPAISRAAVVARPDHRGDLRLIAYLELTAGEPAAPHSPPAAEEFSSYLKQYLPSYMSPSRYVFLDRLPLTDNGKVDRRALPDPPDGGAGLAAMTGVRDDLKALVAVLFADALGLERVGMDEDLFDLGGDSLTVIRITHLVRETLNEETGHTLVFEAPTPALFARAIRDRASHPADLADRAATARAVLELTETPRLSICSSSGLLAARLCGD